MRVCAPLLVGAVAMALCGCGAAVRPDAEVARAVERAEREQRARRDMTALASADDELPTALPAGARTVADDAKDADAADDELPEPGVRPGPWFSTWPQTTSLRGPRPEPRVSLVEDEATNGRQKTYDRLSLRLELFRFKFAGQPVGLKASIKNKHLTFGVKLRL